MGLIQDLKANDKKGLFSSDDNFVMYPTGILPLDYGNGFWQKVMIDGELKDIPAIGIRGGSIVGVIATTGGGKSTLATQVGYNIIKKFPNGSLHFIDCEQTMFKDRMHSITGAPYDSDQIFIHTNNTSVEDVLKIVHKIADAKEIGKYQYEVKNRSLDGKPFKVYEPSVLIIDSLPYFNSDDYSDEDLGALTDAARAAKAITRFLTNITPICIKYNITVFMINHIRTKIEMNAYAPAPKGLLMLGAGESLPRGNVAQYGASTYFRINNTKSAAYDLEKYGFGGTKSQIQLAKSKSNTTGITFPVTFNSDIGFDPVFTLFEFAHHCGLVQGRNPHLYITGAEDFKFKYKDFCTKFETDNLFRRYVIMALKPHLEALLGTAPPSANPIGEEDFETDENGEIVTAHNNSRRTAYFDIDVDLMIA